MRIKKGDTVQIITGKDRGKSGKVMRVNPQQERVIVEGLNLYKKHVKPRRQGEKGQVVEVPRPIHASNVLPWCGSCRKGVRVGMRGEGSSRTRYCKSCNTAI